MATVTMSMEEYEELKNAKIRAEEELKQAKAQIEQELKRITPENTICVSLNLPMDEVERQFILAVYKKHKCHKTITAHSLNIGLKTLYRKLEAYGVK